MSDIGPVPVVEKHGDIWVVRDDLIPGGTKARIVPSMLVPGREYVYASPAYGYAQIALAYSAQKREAYATIFVAKRNALHPRTLEAKRAGAKVVQVPYGYLSNVQAKARAYCEQVGAEFLPFGLDSEDFIDALSNVGKMVAEHPTEVWTVAGSGVLSRALQRVWNDVPFYAVEIGAVANAERATKMRAPESFDMDARIPPPFPSCSNYDAKAWQFIRKQAKPDALFWNVAR